MEDVEDLIERLCTAVSMIMEDEVDNAIERYRGRSIGARITKLEQAGRDITILADAASLLVRRWRDASAADAL